jgi:peptide/nickel transport system permease protein
MLKFILKRLALLIPTLLGVVTLVFFMIALSPGDPARVMLGERANAEQLEALREQLGLNEPLIKQYGLYIGRVARGDLGKSILTQQKITDELAERLPATIELAITATIFSSVLGIILGVAAARKRNSWVDYSTMTGALVGVSMPVFWLALVLIMVFSIFLDLLPTGGRMDVRLYFQPITNFFLLDGLILWFRGEGSKVFFTA